jgi:large subunit ribosomal protein L25
MENKKVLTATKRTVVGKQVAALRRIGQVPAVIYGGGNAATLIQLEAHPASLVINRMDKGNELTLNVAGQTYDVKIKEIQRNAIRGDLLHLDFVMV